MNITNIGDINKGRIHIKRFSLSVCFFIIDKLLIDTGAPSHRAELQSYFRTQAIEQVVLTHHHEDHSGLAGWLEKEMSLPIYMLPETKNILNQSPRIPLYRRIAWGQMSGVQGNDIGSTIETQNYSFKVLHTPGHCHDHLSLYEPNLGCMFTGDLFVASKIKYSLRDESLRDMIHSINKLLSYDFNEVYCAHAGYIKHGRKAFIQKKEFLEEFIEEVLLYYKRGLAIREIREKIQPGIDWKHYLTGGEFSTSNLIKHVLKEYCSPVTAG